MRQKQSHPRNTRSTSATNSMWKADPRGNAPTAKNVFTKMDSPPQSGKGNTPSDTSVTPLPASSAYAADARTRLTPPKNSARTRTITYDSVIYESTPSPDPSPQYNPTPVTSPSRDENESNTSGDENDQAEYQLISDDEQPDTHEVSTTSLSPICSIKTPPNTTPIGVDVWAPQIKPAVIRNPNVLSNSRSLRPLTVSKHCYF